MKPLFDQNLSFKLRQALADIFPASSQVRLLGLAEAEDGVVWQHAKANAFILVTQDSDFADMAALYGPPRKSFGFGVAISRHKPSDCAPSQPSSLPMVCSFSITPATPRNTARTKTPAQPRAAPQQQDHRANPIPIARDQPAGRKNSDASSDRRWTASAPAPGSPNTLISKSSTAPSGGSISVTERAKSKARAAISTPDRSAWITPPTRHSPNSFAPRTTQNRLARHRPSP
jgi:hypothetical protein